MVWSKLELNESSNYYIIIREEDNKTLFLQLISEYVSTHN